MKGNIKVEAQINNLDPQKVRDEQRQELFECIRHFMKYMAFQNINEAFTVPEMANIIRDDMIKLYEMHYERSDNDKPD